MGDVKRYEPISDRGEGRCVQDPHGDYVEYDDYTALLARIEDANASVVAFCAPVAVEYARGMGLSDGHLHPTHYDILEKAGARMDRFTRADLAQIEERGGMMQELKPCPFCGKDAKLTHRKNWGHIVTCQWCCAESGGPYRPTIEMAVSDWNTRAAPARETAVDMLEALRGMDEGWRQCGCNDAGCRGRHDERNAVLDHIGDILAKYDAARAKGDS